MIVSGSFLLDLNTHLPFDLGIAEWGGSLKGINKWTFTRSSQSSLLGHFLLARASLAVLHQLYFTGCCSLDIYSVIHGVHIFLLVALATTPSAQSEIMDFVSWLWNFSPLFFCSGRFVYTAPWWCFYGGGLWSHSRRTTCGHQVFHIPFRGVGPQGVLGHYRLWPCLCLV